MQSLGNAHTVKCIDVDYRNNQFSSQHLSKVTYSLFIGFITQPMICNKGNFLGQFQNDLIFNTEPVLGFPPCTQHGQSPRILTHFYSLFSVNVNTKCTSIDLRSTDLD